MAAAATSSQGRRDWAFPLIVSAIVLAFTALPYLAGLLSSRGDVYTGAVIDPKDYNSYLAIMRQGMAGAWRYRLAYTSEPHEGAVIYVLYLALGHVAGWLRLEPVIVFHLARAGDTVLMFLAVWWLTGRVFPGRSGARRTALLLVAFASGLGWLGLLAGVPVANLPDLYMPEAIPFYTALFDAHYPLALALFVLLTGLVVLPDVPRSRTALAAECLAIAGIALALASVKPYPFLVFFTALGFYALIHLARERRVPWPVLWRAALAGFAALPVLAYQYFFAFRGPVTAGWWSVKLQLIGSPPLWAYALAYAWLLPAALAGAWHAWRPRAAPDEEQRARSRSGSYLACWVVANILWLYSAGVMPQRTFSLGLQVPLALLATLGWHDVLAVRLNSTVRPRARLAWVAASALTNIVLVVSLTAFVGGHNPLLFLGQDEWDGISWLRGHAAGEVVLAGVETSMFVPGWSDARVIAGHPNDTLRAEEKEAALRQFFGQAPDPAVQQAILDRYGASFVWYGPRERALGAPQPRLSSDWVQVFAQGQVAIFERTSGHAAR